MQLMVCLCSIIVAIISFIVVFLIVRDRKSFVYYLLPIFMDMVIIIALYTKEIAVFGILGILGLIPMIKLFFKNNQK